MKRERKKHQIIFSTVQRHKAFHPLLANFIKAKSKIDIVKTKTCKF